VSGKYLFFRRKYRVFISRNEKGSVSNMKSVKNKTYSDEGSERFSLLPLTISPTRTAVVIEVSISHHRRISHFSAIRINTAAEELTSELELSPTAINVGL
jgi:hypothetical protein